VTARTHHYIPQAGTWPSEPPCTCDAPRGARVHQVDEVPEEAREIDARVQGERLEPADG